MNITVTFFLFTFISCTKSYNILAVLPVPTHSHYHFSLKLVQELISQNHKVTFVTPYPKKWQHPNLTEISVEFLLEDVKVISNFFIKKRNFFETARFGAQYGYAVTESVLESKNIQKFLNSSAKFDLILLTGFTNEALIGLSHTFKAPYILVATMPFFQWTNFLLGHFIQSSTVSNVLSDVAVPTNFGQRFWNTIYDYYSIVYYLWTTFPKHVNLAKKTFPDAPHLNEMISNVSLVLINSHSSTNPRRMEAPNVIEIGGLHIEKPKKLPKDLEQFLNNSTNGVILFSLGSHFKSSLLTNSTKTILIKTFSKLKQTVLCKWESLDKSGLPSNVKFLEWLPQNDVLAHPNVKLFITHGGLFSTMESAYHGVPVMGLPVFVDQMLNMATATANGWGKMMHLTEITENKLTNALREILSNPSYKYNAIKRSKVMRNRLVKPKDEFHYWINFVIENGVSHLQYPGRHLHWWQQNSLDIFALLLLTVIGLLWGIKIIFFRSTQKSKRTETKKKLDMIPATHFLYL